MYETIYSALKVLSKGDIADLKRKNIKTIKSSPAYFRVLGLSKSPDNTQTQRVLYLLLNTKINIEEGSLSVAQALIEAGVKESQLIQLTRSGENGIEYLKRQLVRCKNVDLHSLGKLALYWGDNARRQLLKEYILKSIEKFDNNSN